MEHPGHDAAAVSDFEPETTPPESLEHPIRLGIFLFASLIVVFELGLTGNDQWRIHTITWWELIAIINTLLFGFLYFRDLDDQCKKGKIVSQSAVKAMTLGWGTNSLANLAALFLCFWSDWSSNGVSNHSEWIHLCYCACVWLSFVIFAYIDWISAHAMLLDQKKREYWILFTYVDSPAALGFTFIMTYMILLKIFGASSINRDVLSGALVMQMLIADALFLLVASNFHHWYLTTKLARAHHAKTPPSG